MMVGGACVYIHGDVGISFGMRTNICLYVMCFVLGGRVQNLLLQPRTHRCGKMIVATGADHGGDASSMESQRLEVR